MRIIDAADILVGWQRTGIKEYDEGKEAGIDLVLAIIDHLPTIEAYTGAEYMHLLKLAKKMHTWIFLHTLNEDETYKELGLTDEDNALLGSFGKFYYSCNPNTKPFPQAYENGDHIAEVGKKEPICGCPQEGVKIPVISMEDVPKMLEKELPSVEENPILREIRRMRHTEK